MSLRWSEADYARYLRQGQPLSEADGRARARSQGHPAPVSEAAFQAAVIRLAKQYGFMAYHTHNSKRSPEGFPDLVLAKAGYPLLCIELKTETGIVSEAQQAWLEALTGCIGIVSAVWRPSDLPQILPLLANEKGQ